MPKAHLCLLSTIFPTMEKISHACHGPRRVGLAAFAAHGHMGTRAHGHTGTRADPGKGSSIHSRRQGRFRRVGSCPNLQVTQEVVISNSVSPQICPLTRVKLGKKGSALIEVSRARQGGGQWAGGEAADPNARTPRKLFPAEIISNPW